MEEPNFKEAAGSSTGGDGGLAGEDLFAGMKVLAVDDDVVCLAVLCRFLRQCNYNVTECREAKKALEILREKKEYFDLVISDVQMPDMDGLKLLEHMSLELDLPVIMVTTDLSPETVKKGVIHGACDFITKPINMKSIKYIWHHALRRKRMTNNDNNINNNKANDENKSASRSVKKRKETTREDENEEDNGEDGSNKTVKKKAKRFQWTSELNELFINAINQLGGCNGAVPKKILGMMNVPGLTREHVASHLQKHRQAIQKIESAQQAQLHISQTATNHRMISQPINTPRLKPPTNYYTFPKPSSILPTQNPLNTHALLANSISTPGLPANFNMSMPLYLRQQHHQQQQPNNILMNNYQNGLQNFQQFGNITNNRFGASTPSVIYFNNDENIGSNGNGLMGVNKVSLMPNRHALDGLESSNSNLTHSNNFSESLNIPDWCNGLI